MAEIGAAVAVQVGDKILVGAVAKQYSGGFVDVLLKGGAVVMVEEVDLLPVSAAESAQTQPKAAPERARNKRLLEVMFARTVVLTAHNRERVLQGGPMLQASVAAVLAAWAMAGQRIQNALSMDQQALVLNAMVEALCSV